MGKTKNRAKKLEACKRSTRRSTSIQGNSRKLFSFLFNHSRAITTCVLLLFIVGLLFGIASQLRAPATQTAPNGVTTLDYTTFVQQVKTGNMAAVVVQGDEVNGLLRNSIAQTSTSSNTQHANVSQMYSAWLHYVTTENTALSTTPASLNTAYFVYTRLPMGANTQLMPLLLHSSIKITTLPVAQPSPILTLLWRFAPLLLMVAALFFILLLRGNGARATQRMDERITHIGKSRAKRFERSKEVKPQASDKRTQKTSSIPATSSKDSAIRVSATPSATFADVAGIDEVRMELEEIVQFLQRPERFKKLGAHIPRGALLVGPPGTGKTLLARAVAGEAGVPFFSMSASEFVEMFVGVGASRVRDLFDEARQAAPCVIFIDELDAVGRKRSLRVGGNDERDQTLNQLLVELDGFDERHAVVVLAATNRVDILDNALLRPGRFDRRITVSLPDRAGREAILRVHTRNTPLHEDVQLQSLARLTTGMSGADLANLVNEASLAAARRNLDCVAHDCFEHALARVQLGALRPLVMSEKERRIIAYHEGGHALVAYHLPEADAVNRVTILPRGQSLGITHFVAEEDRYNYSRHALMTKIAVALGGRVAEELTFGAEHVTTGAENDLRVVTDLARRMVTRWGMSEEIGVVFADYHAEGNASLNMHRVDVDEIPSSSRTLVAHPDGAMHLNGNYQLPRHAFAQVAMPTRTLTSTTMNALIDSEVQRILSEGLSMARTILGEHSEQLCIVAHALMEHEQLDRTQFEALFV
jgi:cell division protease FtsH